MITKELHPSRLTPHPLNAEIYGVEETDAALLGNVAEFGVMSPIHVLPDGRKTSSGASLPVYTIVAGHRRARYAIENSIDRVQVIIRDDLKTPEQIEHFLLSDNSEDLRRTLTIEQKVLMANKIEALIRAIRKQKSAEPQSPAQPVTPATQAATTDAVNPSTNGPRGPSAPEAPAVAPAVAPVARPDEEAAKAVGMSRTSLRRGRKAVQILDCMKAVLGESHTYTQELERRIATGGEGSTLQEVLVLASQMLIRHPNVCLEYESRHLKTKTPAKKHAGPKQKKAPADDAIKDAVSLKHFECATEIKKQSAKLARTVANAEKSLGKSEWSAMIASCLESINTYTSAWMKGT